MKAIDDLQALKKAEQKYLKNLQGQAEIIKQMIYKSSNVIDDYNNLIDYVKNIK